MSDAPPADLSMFDGHAVTDAKQHAKQTGDGTRAAIAPQPAMKRTMSRRIKVVQRAPFLPDHPRPRHGLHGHSKASKR
jgi:hypothetical protein